jgi:hypothetical protein
MNNTTEAHEMAKQWATDLLRKLPARTEDVIRSKAQLAIQFVEAAIGAGSVDEEQLVAELLYAFSITVERGTALDDFRDHKAWLPDKRASIAWKFWTRYMKYLERDFGMAPDVVNNLHSLTDMVLERLEDPQRTAPWDRRGMVVGSVQSGKTANYTGLVCKAIDAGYKLVIILAGIHSNLRSQTQLRIDEGVLGFDTKKSRKLNQDSQFIGVGRIPGERLIINSLTSSDELGDFRKNIANNIGVMIGSDPVVLVVKKNSSVLKNLLGWVTHVAGIDDPNTGKRIIRDVPLLLIDDEADNASINTKARRGQDDDTDNVPAINGRIRELLAAFDKSAYVGYTATPFANIFINPAAQNQKHGDDIFPRSFIINVKAPSNYVGPSKVFGLNGDTDAGIEAMPALPIIRTLRSPNDFGTEPVDDYALPECFPPKHKITHVPMRLPQSLETAIRCFIITCAARRARGQDRKHSSMLVHVTRFVPVQEITTNLVQDTLISLQRRLREGDGKRSATIRDELRELWESDYIPTSKKLGEEAGQPLAWHQVDAELHSAAAKIEVMTVNGMAKEALDYKDHEENGRSVIAIGGDKLSRGLTLEGLSVSYFLRTSKMYDTLMQMGRWFGYRPGYLDLCRLFTTGELVRWYRHIALAETELRREFDYMVKSGLTPEKYGLRVRTHPDGMIVTALNKMCHSEKLELSWAGVLVQTAHLPKQAELIQDNLKTTADFLSNLTLPEGDSIDHRIWRAVPAASVARYVARLKYPPESSRASGPQLAAFIEKQQSIAELTEWTVVLVSNTQAPQNLRREVAGLSVGLIRRTPESQTAQDWTLTKSNILSPEDESIDLRSISMTAELADELGFKLSLLREQEFLKERIGCTLREVAVALTRKRIQDDPQRWRGNPETERPNGRIVRELRPKSRGLLLIYPLVQQAEVPEDSKVGRTAEPTGMNPDGPPVIGVALSFPTSDTAIGVEYRVNKVWDSKIEDDDYGDHD